MSEQGEETPEPDQKSNPAKLITDVIRSRAFVTLVSYSAILWLVGLLSNTAQIFSVVDTQPQSILAIAILAALLVCVPVFLHPRVQRTRKNISIFAVLLTCLLVSLILAWPESRKLTEWAADVNGVCVEEFEQARSAIKDMESAGYAMIEAAKPFQTKPEESIANFFAAVDDPMRRAHLASSRVSNQHGATLRRVQSLKPPVVDFEKDKAESWINEYEEYAEDFHELHEALLGYTTSDGVKDKTKFFTDSISYITALQTKKNDVVELGKSIQVDSCF